MEDAELKKSYRNGWILFAGLAIYVVLMVWLAIETNMPGARREFDMGAVPFVPGESWYATEYYHPVGKVETGYGEADRDIEERREE